MTRQAWIVGAAGAFMISASGCGAAPQAEAGTPAAAEDAVGGEAACGGDGPEGELSWDDRQLIADYEEQMAGFEVEMTEAMELQTGADCAGAARLRDNICDLAERICAIHENNPDNEDVGAMCQDGQQRCERATADVAEACGG